MRTMIAAAAVTTAVLAPAGWHATDADLQADGPALRPAQQTLTIDDATITIDVDRGIQKAGGFASATLVATSARPHTVKVDVTAIEDMGYGAERVPNPPVTVGRRELALRAAPGGGPPVVASFKLASAKLPPGIASWFDLVVAKHGSKEEDAARVGVATWSGNSVPITVEPPAQIPAEGAFTFAVRIKNTTKQALDCAYARVGSAVTGNGGLEGRFMIGDGEAFSIDDITASDDDESAIAPGAEKLWLFKITPARADIRTFVVIAQVQLCNGGGDAMESATFVRPPPAEPTPSVAAR